MAVPPKPLEPFGRHLGVPRARRRVPLGLLAPVGEAPGVVGDLVAQQAVVLGRVALLDAAVEVVGAAVVPVDAVVHVRHDGGAAAVVVGVEGPRAVGAAVEEGALAGVALAVPAQVDGHHLVPQAALLRRCAQGKGGGEECREAHRGGVFVIVLCCVAAGELELRRDGCRVRGRLRLGWRLAPFIPCSKA